MTEVEAGHVAELCTAYDIPAAFFPEDKVTLRDGTQITYYSVTINDIKFHQSPSAIAYIQIELIKQHFDK